MSVPLPLALPSLPAPADPDLPPVHLGPSEQRPPTLSARALAALSVPGTPQPLAFFNATVRAGFPSPAADHSHKRIDLNDHLVRNREATFLFRVRGDSMTGAGIYDGDTLVIDRSLDARHHHIGHVTEHLDALRTCLGTDDPMELAHHVGVRVWAHH